MFIDEMVDFAVSVFYDDGNTTVSNNISTSVAPNNDPTDTGKCSISYYILHIDVNFLIHSLLRLYEIPSNK